MNRFITISAIVVGLLLLAYLYSVYYKAQNPYGPAFCDWPLTYSIGVIDDEFDITDEQLTSILDEVEVIWSSPFNRPILQRSNNGILTVNLIYSEDQERTDQRNQYSSKLEQKYETYRNRMFDYNRMQDRLRDHQEQHSQILARLESHINRYNKHIKEPSASPEQLQEKTQAITELQEEFRRSAEQLSAIGQEVEDERKNLNTLGQELSTQSTKFNQQFAVADTFNQGLYIRSRGEEMIIIYQFDSMDHLRLVLAHEFGHALGLGHAEDPSSIMNKLLASQSLLNPRLSDEDIQMLKDQCDLD